jgi:hypothetical protein
LKSDGEIKEALQTFKDVVTTEQERGEKGDWGFKALKQMTKITFHQVGTPLFCSAINYSMFRSSTTRCLSITRTC